jgi:hypothetical protein
MDADLIMTRREMVEQALRVAALPGAALFFSAFLSASTPDLLANYQPKFFSPDDFQALQSFTEILIPSDDTPGAREAGCAQYIDFVLDSSSETPPTQAAWREAMQAVKAAGFHAADASRQVELVTEMSRPELDATTQHPAFFAYRLIKQQNAFAFYTSRKGMIETLDYKGNSYNPVFPACKHPEHQRV